MKAICEECREEKEIYFNHALVFDIICEDCFLKLKEEKKILNQIVMKKEYYKRQKEKKNMKIYKKRYLGK